MYHFFAVFRCYVVGGIWNFIVSVYEYVFNNSLLEKVKKRQTEEAVGRQYQRVDRNGLCQLNKGS